MTSPVQNAEGENPHATRDLAILGVMALVFIIAFIYVNQKRKAMETAGEGGILDVAIILDNSSLRNICMLMLVLIIATLGFVLYLAILSGVDMLSGYVYAAIVAIMFYIFLQSYNAFSSINSEIATSDPGASFDAVQMFEGYLALAGSVVFGCAVVALLRKYGAEARSKIASFSLSTNSSKPSNVPVEGKGTVLGNATNTLLGVCRQSALHTTVPK